MSNDAAPSEKARQFFDDIWRKDDYWDLETSPYERDKYAHQLERIAHRRYRSILEIGCGAGHFTRALAGLADRVVAIDVSAVAIEKARAGGDAGGAIDFRAADVMKYKPADDGPFDLIVMSETVCLLGWLYTFFDVAWATCLLFDATADDGLLLMTNTHGGLRDHLYRPWLIHTYRDLFRNVGYQLDREDPFFGEKNGVTLESTTYVFRRPAGSAPRAV